jgi:hypothetical protein
MIALSGGVVFKKFHLPGAFGAFGVKNGPRLPISAVLSWTFHNQ